MSKIALITGASTGIGAAVSSALEADAIRVAICDVNQVAGEALAQRIGGAFIHCDVTSLASVESAVKTCVDQLGVPDFVHLKREGWCTLTPCIPPLNTPWLGSDVQ
jgi:NAD(P)-dependent dehydrogenase (short-subunit alcohol dehydrogenase family)